MMENLDKKTLEKILIPKPMNTLPQLWLSQHHRILKHPLKNEMCRLTKLGIISKEVFYFKDKPASVCVSYAFVTALKNPSINKKGIGHTI